MLKRLELSKQVCIFAVPFLTKTKQNMELNQGEFDTLTKKLEQYAAQLSTLQTKLELQPEIGSLKEMYCEMR